jgi:hypothetical protein
MSKFEVVAYDALSPFLVRTALFFQNTGANMVQIVNAVLNNDIFFLDLVRKLV